MSEKIYSKTINGKQYYYLQKSMRIKIDVHNCGKEKGSGKSKVVTKTEYLGTAETIKKKLQTIKEPIEIKNQHFGFIASLLSVSKEVGLIDLLQKYINGQTNGIENWKYFLLAIINRLQHATSKEKMGQWAATTVLPELLDFDPKKLTGKSFWYATDNVISQRELKEKRQSAKQTIHDVFTNINDQTFKTIEQQLVKNILELYQLSPQITIYDTTNFFNYFSKENESLLAQTGHSKEGKHSNRLIGLALSVEKKYGIPLFHQIYRGNSHDSNTFYEVISELISVIKDKLKLSENLTLIIDKGNNSHKNFNQLKNQIQWIGSFSIHHHKDLADIELEDYQGIYKDLKYYQTTKQIYQIPLKLVLTFKEKLYRKQEHTFNNNIEKFKAQVYKKWHEYKKTPTIVPAAIKTMLEKSKHKDYLKIKYRQAKLIFELDEAKIQEKKKYWGKHIIFSSNLEKSYEEIIKSYNSKDKIEKSFQLIKSPDLIRWMPMRHWTDSKIRAFAFSCVMSLLLIRVMELKLDRENFKMSPNVIKAELTDIQQTTLIYDEKTVVKKITSKSTVQKKLCEIFNLNEYEKVLTIH
jgi:transposase